MSSGRQGEAGHDTLERQGGSALGPPSWREEGQPETSTSGTMRERLMQAAIRVVAQNGYEEAGIADVAERAGASSEDLYQEFDDLEACVLAAYDWLVEQVAGRVCTAYELGALSSWPEGVRQGLAALLEAIAEHPVAARMALIEVPPAGPKAHARYREAVARFAPMLQTGREYSEMGDELPDHVELMAIGSVEAVIFDEVSSGGAARLLKMLPEILFAVLVPYLGPEDAAAEMQAAAAPAG